MFGGGDRLVPSLLFLGTVLDFLDQDRGDVVREMDFMRCNLGQLIVATRSWKILRLGDHRHHFRHHGRGGAPWLQLAGLGKTVAGVVLFLVFCFTVGRWLVFPPSAGSLTFSAVIFLVTSIVDPGDHVLFREIIWLLGVRTVLGAFMAGVLIGESPFSPTIFGASCGPDHGFLHADLFWHVGAGAATSHHPEIRAGRSGLPRCWWGSRRLGFPRLCRALRWGVLSAKALPFVAPWSRAARPK